MNRRRFLKYAGATAAVAGASALGGDYVLKARPSSMNQTNVVTTTSMFNLQPVADFTYEPTYLNPKDQQTIQFTNLSTDLRGDPLTYAWYVDNQPASAEKDYSTKLPVGQHTVELEASDRFAKGVTAQAVTVEPDQIYPAKPLRIRYKGMKYAAGRGSPELVSTPMS